MRGLALARRATLLVALVSCSTATALAAQAAPRVVLFVDPCKGDGLAEVSTFYAAAEVHGATVLPVWSDAMVTRLTEDELKDEGLLQAPAVGDERRWAAETLGGAQLAAVLCGSDGGLACAERLQHELIPERSNGIDKTRRDKYLANEACRAAGMAMPAQAAPTTWKDAEAFLTKLRGSDSELRCVLKPRRGTASVGVFAAQGMEQAREIYGLLSKTVVSIDKTELADVNVVLQELLIGDEWIVDTVSADGEHKVVALWKYDKGVVNNAPFVYHSAQLMPATEAEAELAEYACAALDALKWQWGPAHIEVRMTSAGPRLVEVNAGRCNGLDFKLLADLGYGYNQFDATVDAWLSDDVFSELPPRPPAQLACHGRIVTLVSEVAGKLVRINHAEEIEQMTSLLNFEPEASEPGDEVKHTTDLGSWAGYAQLAHCDPDVLEADYRRLRELQSTMFEVE